LIEEDFIFASQNLLIKGQKQEEPIKKLLMYLGKVLLYEKKYDEALTALNNVTGYSLEDKGNFITFMEQKQNTVKNRF